MHFFVLEPFQMTRFSLVQKGPKTTPKGQKHSKTAPNETMAKLLPTWPQKNLKVSQNQVQHHPKMTLFCSHFGAKMAYIARRRVTMAHKRSKKVDSAKKNRSKFI